MASNIKKLRILLLLLVLLAVAGGEFLTRSRATDWDVPLWVVIYPINADGSAITNQYIHTLEKQTFSPIENFFKREAKSFNSISRQPFKLQLAKPIASQPPLPPQAGNILAVMWWSLKLRFWAWQYDNFQGPKDIQMFVRYFDPDKTQHVAHSLGLQKGMVGIVNAFASTHQNAQNNVIISHEILHTLGASDKYHFSSNQPLYPIGYAEPEKSPLYPQTKAELMAGRIPVSEFESVIPKGLKYVKVGKQTAFEIRWIKHL